MGFLTHNGFQVLSLHVVRIQTLCKRQRAELVADTELGPPAKPQGSCHSPQRGRPAKAPDPHPPWAGATTREPGGPAAGSAPPMGPHAGPGVQRGGEGAGRRTREGHMQLQRGNGWPGLQAEMPAKHAASQGGGFPVTAAPSGHRLLRLQGRSATRTPVRGGPRPQGAAPVRCTGLPPTDLPEVLGDRQSILCMPALRSPSTWAPEQTQPAATWGVVGSPRPSPG